jgi:DNA-binding transcriptional LysR family regulator
MQPKTDLGDVVAFAAVVETGSLARAAERIGVSKSLVSRRVARLEAHLGARLLTRSASGAVPTEAGRIYFVRVGEAMAGLEAAREAVTESVSHVAGMIRLAAPQSFGTRYLAPALAEFLAAHPRVELDAVFDDRRVDLVGEGFDLAVRIGNLPDSSLIARWLAPVRRVVIASPEYIAREGEPARPRDLAGHALLLYANVPIFEQWRFSVDGRDESVRGRARLRANSGELQLAAVEAGLGVAILPTFIAGEAIGRGSVRVILAEWPLAVGGLHAVMPPGRGASARVRALVDFLAGRFGPEPSWDPCWGET